MPAQYYPDCAQITITGGGDLGPTAAGLCTLPGCYNDNDPGLNIDIYDLQAEVTYNYTIPGPPLYGSSSSGSGSGGDGGGERARRVAGSGFLDVEGDLEDGILSLRRRIDSIGDRIWCSAFSFSFCKIAVDSERNRGLNIPP